MSHTAIQPYHGSYLMPSLEHATVADAMHPGILTCPPDADLVEVARSMASNHVHCVAVMGISHDDSGESLSWGIISDVDLLRGGLEAAGEGTAGVLAQDPIITVGLSTPVRVAGQLMLEHGVTHLVVIADESQRPVGIISTLDVAGVLAWGEA